MYLKRPTSAQIHDFILSQFAILWDEFAADRALIPPGRLVEITRDYPRVPETTR